MHATTQIDPTSSSFDDDEIVRESGEGGTIKKMKGRLSASRVWKKTVAMTTCLVIGLLPTFVSAFAIQKAPLPRLLPPTITVYRTFDGTHIDGGSSITSSASTTSLRATSSRELRKREEEEKRIRMERRRTANARRKLKTTTNGSTTSSSTTNTLKIKGIRPNGITTAVRKSSDISKVKIKKRKKLSPTNKNKPEPKKRTDLMQRLQAATAKAKAAAIEADYANKRQQILHEGGEQKAATGSNSGTSSTGRNTTEEPPIATLTQLTRVIDKELRAASDGTATFNVHGTTNPPPGITRDSMRSLLDENDAQWKKSKRRQHHQQRLLEGTGVVGTNNQVSSNPVRHVAVVVSKHLVKDQVTLEYACRLRTLAKAMKYVPPDTIREIPKNDEDEDETEEEEFDMESTPYQPSIICFLGATSSGNLVSDADAGYIFFNHLCAANEISLDAVDILLEKTTLGSGAMKHVMRHLRQEYVPEWLEDPPKKAEKEDNNNKEEEDDDEEEEEEEYSFSLPTSSRKKVQLHFTFFSSDYDLCRINDVHYRSPRQSVLKHLLEQEDVQEDDLSTRLQSSSSRADLSEKIQTSWSYRFSSYPYVHFKDPVTAYLGKCYLLAEELTPVLVNIHGVVDGTEFFQRDNYRVLVSIRRSFVTDMEHFYKSQPSLKSTLRQYVSNSDYPLDVVLEGALLSLGRCLDLVRPAGLLIGYVPKEDWKTAEIVLQHAVTQLRNACDPDHPLDPTEWGNLDHHYDQHADRDASTDLSNDDLAALTNWRTQEEEDDGEDEEATMI